MKKIKKIDFTEKEIKQIYEEAERQARSRSNLLQEKLQRLQLTLKNIENNIEEIYQDKINKLIQIEDFKTIYEKKQKERNKILKEIDKLKKELEESKQKSPKIDLKKIKQITSELLKMETLNKIVLEKLIEKIEFDKEKKIQIKFTFEVPTS